MPRHWGRKGFPARNRALLSISRTAGRAPRRRSSGPRNRQASFPTRLGEPYLTLIIERVRRAAPTTFPASIRLESMTSVNRPHRLNRIVGRAGPPSGRIAPMLHARTGVESPSHQIWNPARGSTGRVPGATMHGFNSSTPWCRRLRGAASGWEFVRRIDAPAPFGGLPKIFEARLPPIMPGEIAAQLACFPTVAWKGNRARGAAGSIARLVGGGPAEAVAAGFWQGRARP